MFFFKTRASRKEEANELGNGYLLEITRKSKRRVVWIKITPNNPLEYAKAVAENALEADPERNILLFSVIDREVYGLLGRLNATVGRAARHRPLSI